MLVTQIGTLPEITWLELDGYAAERAVPDEDLSLLMDTNQGLDTQGRWLALKLVQALAEMPSRPEAQDKP